MSVKQIGERDRATTEDGLTVVVGPVQQGQDEIQVLLHCNLCRTLDGDPSVSLPFLAVAVTRKKLDMKVR